MSKRKPRRCWSKSIGERGYRVRVYEARPGGTIMRSVYINGKEARKSLGHRDKQLAIQHAYELLHALFANETAIEDESLTVGLLENLYIESPSTSARRIARSAKMLASWSVLSRSSAQPGTRRVSPHRTSSVT